MAKFRMVDTEFWNEPQVQEQFTPEDKLFYLYLMTNPATKQIGIYTITKKKMAFELGYSIETINSLMSRFQLHHKLIDYDDETREIILLRWSETAFRKGGKPINDLVISELANVKRIDWIARIAPLIPIESVRQVVMDYMEKKDIEPIYDSYNDTCNDSYNDAPTRTKKEERRTKKEERRTKDIVQQAELFESWWNLYGIKVGKKKCESVFMKHLKEYGFEKIMDGTKRYFDYRTDLSNAKAFVPQQKNPLTFLNGEHFNDEYENITPAKGSINNGPVRKNEAAFARTIGADGNPVRYGLPNQ